MSELHYSNFRAVAFDFDGTLCDTNHLHDTAREEAFRRIAVETGDSRYTNIPSEIHAEAHHHGSNPLTIIGWVLQQAGLVGEDAAHDPATLTVVKLKSELYAQSMMTGGEAIGDAVPLIRKLSSRSPGKQAIVTTARRTHEVMPFLNRYKINRYFPDNRLVTCEDVPAERMKPDSLAYEIMLDRFGLTNTPEKMLVIEDSAYGIEAAKKVGATVVAVATTRTEEALNRLQGYQHPDAVAIDFMHLSGMLGIR